jgi:hypothetical protein
MGKVTLHPLRTEEEYKKHSGYSMSFGPLLKPGSKAKAPVRQPVAKQVQQGTNQKRPPKP